MLLADKLIIHFDNALRASAGTVGKTPRPSPAQTIKGVPLSDDQRELSARLMRVNHCGEVCAQALYHGQAIAAKSDRVATSMAQAATEETDHLSWCETRLRELDSHVSYLNPVWYASSFVVGAITGLLGDKISLGFVAATEEAVCRHLEVHLEKLPADDVKSRAIISQMKLDEAKHQAGALDAGGVVFPGPLKSLMAGVSKLMTRSTYWV